MRAPHRPHTTLKVAREDWLVLIRDAHPGYIGWTEFEHNQTTLTHNANGFGLGHRGSLPREGVGLLQGRVVCGLCGARMRVRYQAVAGKLEPYYMCTENAVRRAAKPCQSLRGHAIDQAVSTLLLENVAPAAIAMALAVERCVSCSRCRRPTAISSRSVSPRSASPSGRWTTAACSRARCARSATRGSRSPR